MTVYFICMLSITAMLGYISYVDLKHMLIPNKAVLFILAAGILSLAADFSPAALASALAGLLLSGGLFFLIAWVSKGAMGGGDIKLMGVLGFFLGIRLAILHILLSVVLGGLVALILVLLGVKKRTDTIPFGPFIAVAGVLAMFWGNEMVMWYLRQLGI